MLPVAAVDESNFLATFSNYGPLVPLAAPGVDILSACTEGRLMGFLEFCEGGTIPMSGTSMAGVGWNVCGRRATYAEAGVLLCCREVLPCFRPIVLWYWPDGWMQGLNTQAPTHPSPHP